MARSFICRGNTTEMGAQFSEPLDLDVALTRIRDQIEPKGAGELVPLTEAAGRILAQPVTSPIALPPFANSAMDGYAVADAPHADLAGHRYRQIGTSAAGHPFEGRVAAGECVRIFTGAAVPAGTGRVILQEDTDMGTESVVVTGTPDPRTNIRPVGHDVEAGDLLDQAGVALNAFRIGRYAASGINVVEVHKKPRVGVFSTGDELAALDVTPEDLPPGCIYESNRHALIAMLKDLPVDVLDLGNLKDDAKVVETALSGAAERCDFILTSGGVSVGDHDHVKGAVEALGQLEFWRLNLKPGKPLAFGRLNRAWFFGLPGNPVSTIVTWLLIAKPALLALCGAEPTQAVRLTAKLDETVRHTPGRTEFQRGTFTSSTDGLTVRISGHQASNRLSSFAEANCLVEIPKDIPEVAAGSDVTILPLAYL